MKFDVSQLRRGAVEPNKVDGRGQTFFVAQSTKVASLLHALPMVKGEALPMTTTGSDTDPTVQIKRASTLSNEADFYVRDTTLNKIPDLPGSEVLVPLKRLGMQWEELVIDAKATPDATAHRESYWKALTAAHSALRKLDLTIAQGDSGTGHQFNGLSKLLTYSKTTGTSIDEDAQWALSMVFPSGCGTGEGPHCLIGNRRMLRKLMATTGGQNGTSGWRHDPRSGLFVFHYMGVPFYCTDVLTVTPLNTSTLYAANLGPTGLNLVYAYGTPDSFGLEVSEVSANASRGVRDMAIHGAFALALWETRALYGITGISVGDET